MSVTLAGIRTQADGAYPAEVLEGCGTALLLFAGAFRGRNDGIFVADAGIAATCVDIRPEGLLEMEAAYPVSWEFACMDAFEFAAAAADMGSRWDVVSVDCPTNLFDRCGDLVSLWCRLARRAVVLGTGPSSSVTAPAGWRITGVRKRSEFRGGVYWSVLEC